MQQTKLHAEEHPLKTVKRTQQLKIIEIGHAFSLAAEAAESSDSS
jgi:hypothetical protein